MDVRPRCKSGISKLRFTRPPKVYRRPRTNNIVNFLRSEEPPVGQTFMGKI